MSARSTSNAVDGDGDFEGGGDGHPRGSVCGLFQRAYGFVKNLFTKARKLFKGVEEECSFMFSCCSCSFGFAWECVQLWTPLSITFLLYWLVYRPDHFHPRIDSAVLAALDLTNATTATPALATALRYDLAADLSFRNTRRVAIRYLDVAASVFYNGSLLGPTDDAIPSFYQVAKNTTIFHPTFHGVVNVDSVVATELQRELDAGTVHIRVTVSLTLMYKVLFVRDVFFYKYDCWLWFSPPRNHTPTLFSAKGGTQCWRI